MPAFRTWLVTQNYRNDELGRLAKAAALDKKFPKTDKLVSIENYLINQGANERLLTVLRSAYQVYRSLPVPAAMASAGAAPTLSVLKKPNQKSESKKAVPAKPMLASEKTVPVQSASAKTHSTAKSAKQQTTAATRQAKGKTDTKVNKPEPVAEKESRPENKNKKTAQQPVALPEVITPIKTPEVALAVPKAQTQNKLAEAAHEFDQAFGPGTAKKNPKLVIEWLKTKSYTEAATLLIPLFEQALLPLRSITPTKKK